jgi:hypothetical protein
VSTYTYQLEIVPVTAPVGDSGGIAFVNQPLVSPCVIGYNPIFGGSIVDAPFKLGCMGYAQEVWQRTAGAYLRQTVLSPVEWDQAGSFTLSTDELVELQISSVPPPKGASCVLGTPNVYKIGVVSFIYNGNQGPMHYISFTNQVLYPERPNCTGFQYALYPGWTASSQSATKPLNGMPLIVKSTAVPLNFANNQPVPLVAGSGSSDTYAFTPAMISTPYTDGSRLPQQTTDTAQSATFSTITGWSNLPIDNLLTAYIAETWEAVCQAQSAAAGSIVGPFAGSKHQDGTPPVLKWFDLVCETINDEQPQSYGLPGVVFYGYAAFMHNGFFGELQYINFPEQRFFPKGPGATGWYVNMVEDTNAQVFPYGQGHTVNGSVGVNGTINLVNGDVAGLLL